MQSLYFKAFDFIENYKPSHIGIYFSLILHLFILLFAIGLPDFFKPKKIPMQTVIPIEILNISDVTSIIPKKENTEIENKTTKEIQQKKFSSSDNTEIQKIDIREKPSKKINTNKNLIDDSSKLEKPDSKNLTIKTKEINKTKKPNKIIEENIESLKLNKIKPKLKPKVEKEIENKSDVKIENKIKPIVAKNDKKVIDKPKIIEKPEPDFNLATMLKDLRNEDILVNNSNNKEIDNKEEKIKDDQDSNLEVSISEMDLVLQQLRSCFNPRAGTQIVGDEMVKISAKIDRQANVRKDTVQIIDTNISKNNPYYEAITESAAATLYNPLCSKLKLPLDKYESWKDLKITIDYSWIKN